MTWKKDLDWFNDSQTSHQDMLLSESLNCT